jgi:hypothetical protein
MLSRTAKTIFKDAVAMSAAALLLLSGCSGLPVTQRQSNATTEVSEKWSRDQNERLQAVFSTAATHDGEARVEWSVDNNERGNGDQSTLSMLENSIPGGLSLMYYAIGILILFWVIKKVVSSSRAVSFTLSAADSAIARQIRKLEGKLSGHLSDSEKAEVMSMLRDLEHERGKLRT